MEELLIAEHEAATTPQAPAPKKAAPKKLTQEEKDMAAEKKQAESKFFKRISPEELRRMDKPERAKYYKWLADRDREKVTGVFRFFERPGGDLEFVFGEYLDAPVEKYHLVDGQTHEISLGAARHLNKNGWYPEYEYVPGGKNILVPGGQPTNMRMGKKVRRFAFQKLDFMEEDLSEYGQAVNGIVSVEFVGNQNIVDRPS